MDITTDVINQYIDFLQIRETNGKTILPPLANMITTASVALNKLNSEITSESIDKMDRFTSALKGVGLALAAVAYSVVAIVVFLVAALAHYTGDGSANRFKEIGALFSKSFNAFKKACAPGDEQPKLRKLSRDLSECIQKMDAIANPKVSNKQPLFFFQSQEDSQQDSSIPTPQGRSNPS
jgi:hypothetical protein